MAWIGNIRARFILTALFAFVLCSQTYGSPVITADFNVTAPKTWQPISINEISIYRLKNSTSKQTVIVEKAQVGRSQAGFGYLASHQASIERSRAHILARFGLREYSIYAIDEAKDPKGRRYQIIQSRFLGFRDQEVQVYERQFVVGDLVYRITYTEESPALNNLERIKNLLDTFQPRLLKHNREPASEALESVAASRTIAPSPQAGSGINRIFHPPSADYCKGIERQDSIFASGWTDINPLSDGIAGCIADLGWNLIDLINQIYVGADDVIANGKSSQTWLAASNVLAEFQKDKSGFLSHAIDSATNSIGKSIPRFRCYSLAKRFEYLCKAEVGAVAII